MSLMKVELLIVVHLINKKAAESMLKKIQMLESNLPFFSRGCLCDHQLKQLAIRWFPDHQLYSPTVKT